ncbi:MAG TPA: hypothetical protein HPQ04_04505 [Rhodospirillaceae bacterium]|nr:hypothetical protein [Rhodospirillaceae bacterium]
MKTAIGLILALLILGVWRPAAAAGAEPLLVTYDKVRLVRLDAAARRLIVANPAVADVSLETPTLLYIFGKAPGETNLVVLGEDDRPLLSLPVVVAPETERTVSVHVPTNEGSAVRTYSCAAGRCVHIASPEALAGTAAPAAAPAAPSSAEAAVTPMSSTAGAVQGGR